MQGERLKKPPSVSERQALLIPWVFMMKVGFQRKEGMGTWRVLGEVTGVGAARPETGDRQLRGLELASEILKPHPPPPIPQHSCSGPQ